jgi:hypothetical protein
MNVPALTITLSLVLHASPEPDRAAPRPEAPEAQAAGAARAGRATGVALYAASPLALGAGLAAASLSDDEIGAGLGVAYALLGTAGLAAVGAHRYMRSQPGLQPRWWTWWVSFVPLATSVAVVRTTDTRGPRAAALLGSGLGLTVASFGIVAFTDLGYAPGSPKRPGSSEPAPVAPHVSLVRTSRGPEPALGFSLAF